MFRIIRPLHRLLMPPVVGFLLLIVVAPSCRKTSSPPDQSAAQSKPQAKEPAGPSPSSILAGRKLHNPPPLSGAGDEVRRAVASFIDWAGASLTEEQEDGRRVLQGARENKEVVTAFTEEITKAQRTDHSRALLALALLGEMRSPHSEEFLRQFVNQPLPREGTKTIEGETVEQTALATLQAKAIDGLAYLNTESANQEVLRQVKDHASIIVRAEAISAYLWNQKDKAAARRTLLQYVRKGEERYLDQITREEGETAGSFNPKLAAYLKAHPEVAPPAPQYGQEEQKPTQDQVPNPGPPPKF